MAEQPTSPEPRWLAPEERATWMNLAGLLFRLPAELDRQLQRDEGMTLFEYGVLAGLSEAPGRSRRMTELAAFANGSPSRLSHVMSRLERQGWVRREPCPEDRRATNAVLTDQGWTKLVASAPQHVETVRALVLEPLTAAQVRQLGQIAARILRRLDGDGACPEGPAEPRSPRSPR